MSFSRRAKRLLLTMTSEQRADYEHTIRAVDLYLNLDPKRPFMLQDGHRLYVAERVLTDRPIDINKAVEFYEPNPHTVKEKEQIKSSGPSISVSPGASSGATRT